MGVVVAMLAITGVTIWWKKRRARRHVTAALQPAATQPPAGHPTAAAVMKKTLAARRGADARARRALVVGVLGVHLAGWALMQVEAVRQAVNEAAPLFVSLLAPPPPPPLPRAATATGAKAAAQARAAHR